MPYAQKKLTANASIWKQITIGLQSYSKLHNIRVPGLGVGATGGGLLTGAGPA